MQSAVSAVTLFSVHRYCLVHTAARRADVPLALGADFRQLELIDVNLQETKDNIIACNTRSSGAICVIRRARYCHTTDKFIYILKTNRFIGFKNCKRIKLCILLRTMEIR